MRGVQRSLAITGLALMLGGGASFGQANRKPISNPSPAYPDLAKKMHVSGVVKVSVLVGADGQIKNAEFQGGHPLLIDAVQTALKGWKFAPASTESRVMLEFKF